MLKALFKIEGKHKPTVAETNLEKITQILAKSSKDGEDHPMDGEDEIVADASEEDAD